MGNSSSSSKETLRANERAYIRSLGDRYPLGDAELRKWCWCHGRLISSSTPPVVTTSSESLLSLLVAWSSIYGGFNPYARQPAAGGTKNPINGRINAANKACDAIRNVEQHILPTGLSSIIIQNALGLSMKLNQPQQPSSDIDPIQSAKSLSTIEDVSSFEESFYSIAASIDDYLASRGAYTCGTASQSQSLEEFLEGISTSCGRRGSRASLSKLFAICTSHPNNNRREADAHALIQTAYCLTLAASYMRNVASSGKGVTINVQDFVPQNNSTEMQPMIDSLITFAKKQRQNGGGGIGGNFGFDYTYSNPSNATNTASSRNDTTNVSLEEFLEWSETIAPMMASSLPTFLHVLFTFFSPESSSGDGDKEPRFPPGVTPLWIPTLTVDQTKQTTHTSPTSSFFIKPSSSSFDLFALSCTSLTLASGRWHRLFSSEANGLSCNRLMHSILGYGGPTIIIIRSKDSSDKGKCNSGVFGAYTHTPWTQESSSFYGSSDCFLFRLGPDPMSVYRPKGGGDIDAFGTTAGSNNNESETRNYMYFNPEARSKGFDGLAHGIGFGATADHPRLYIDEVLDGCRAAPEDLTYEKGSLLSGLKESNTSATSHFEVEALEAWGVGSSELVEEALIARDGQREDAQKKIRQAMKGAKGQFLEDFQSGLTGNKLFQHREQMRARDGGCDLDEAEGDE